MVAAVTRSCSYRAQAIRHHLLSTERATTLACSLILTRLDYCNSLLYGPPTSSIQTLQSVQDVANRIVLQARRSFALPLLRQLHWLPVQHRIHYNKIAVLTYKIRNTTVPTHTSVTTSSCMGPLGHYGHLMFRSSSA